MTLNQFIKQFLWCKVGYALFYLKLNKKKYVRKLTFGSALLGGGQGVGYDVTNEDNKPLV